MSSGGGDTGGIADFSGGGDSGGGGKGSGGGGDAGDAGGGGKGSGGGGAVDFGAAAPGYESGGSSGYDPYSGTSGGSSGYDPYAGTSSDGSDPLGYSAGESAGFQGSGALPPEITGGASDSGGSMWGAPSINDFISSDAYDGYNLSGSGPVGGDSGLAGMGGGTNTPTSLGTFSTDTSGTSMPSIDTSGAAPAAGGASAFAAPSGVSGMPELDSLVSAPAATGSISPADQNIFDSLNGAQAGAVSEYADTRSLSVPSETGSTTLPAVSSSSGGGGNSQTTGMFDGMGGTKGLGVAAAGVGLLNNLVNGSGTTPATSALQGQATTNSATSADLLARGKEQGDQYGTPALQSGQDQVAKGAALQQFVATGTLPQGYEDQIQQAAASAKSTIISNYANRGLPTDPTRNSALAQELAQVDARLPAAREQLASSLATTGNSIVGAGNQTSQIGNALTGNALVSGGLQAANISSGTYQALANLETSQNKDRGAAIANFAAALNGGTKGSGVNINLGKAA